MSSMQAVRRLSPVIVLLALSAPLMGQHKVRLKAPVDLLLGPYVGQDTTVQAAPFLPSFDPGRLPLFCKWEHRMGAASKYNVKVRLGDVDEVDRLKGKGVKLTPRNP